MPTELSTAGAVILFGSWLAAISIIVIGILSRWYSTRWWKQPYIGGSLLAVSVLFLYGAFTGEILVPSDFLGVALSKLPIVVLILSFAYLAISLDISGFFDYCAAIIVRRSRGNGVSLFVNLFLLVSALTVFTSNDIVILTMTPIVIYVGRRTRLKNMVPYLISQFFAANILSMALYIGSPTNIVIGEALGWTFLDYASWMMVPALVSGATALLIAYWIFRRSRRNAIPDRFDESPGRRRLVFSREMKLKVAIFACLLTVLSLTSFEAFQIAIWKVCLAFAGVALIADLVLLSHRASPKRRFFGIVVGRMPWGIVPFAYSFFCLTTALNKVGITRLIGSKMLEIVKAWGGGDPAATNLVGSVLFGEVSGFFVNIMNDIPTTVLFAEVLRNMQARLADQPALFRAITTGTLVGVNPGCNMTIIGALAGLMWIHIMQTKQVPGEQLPSARDLSKYGVPIMAIVILAGSVAAWIQVMVRY